MHRLRIRKVDGRWFVYSGTGVPINYYDTFEEAREQVVHAVDFLALVRSGKS